jgi:hypothetical protein
LPSVSPVDLAVVLNTLADKGLLRRRYRVIAPTTRTYTDHLYESPTEIPTELWDTSADPFKTADADVVQVFTEADPR